VTFRAREPAFRLQIPHPLPAVHGYLLEKTPVFKEYEPGHKVACHLYSQD
jgi:hypothetical protein